MPRSSSRKTILSRLLDSTSDAVYALDATGQLVYYNPAMGVLLGVDEEALLGQQCQYSTAPIKSSDTTAFARSLGPPPEVYSGQKTSVAVALPTSSGLQEHIVHFVPTMNDGTAVCVFAFVRDKSPSSPDATDPAPRTALHNQLRRLRAELGTTYDIEQLLGTSPPIKQAHRQARLAASVASHVLIVGPIGSGREQLGRTIHYAARSNSARLIPLGCKFLDDELLLSNVRSLLARGENENPTDVHTLLLLDVDQLETVAQNELKKLLSARPDPTVTIPQWRVIATSRSQLRSLTSSQASSFDSELACQLSTIQIQLPPLCDRVEDIPVLAQRLLERHVLERDALSGVKAGAQIDAAANELLLAHSWPENIDELNAAMLKAYQSAGGGRILAKHLPRHMLHVVDAQLHPPATDQPIDLEQLLAGAEAEMIRRSLRKAGSNKAQAARLLGFSRQKILRRMEQLEIIDW